MKSEERIGYFSYVILGAVFLCFLMTVLLLRVYRTLEFDIRVIGVVVGKTNENADPSYTIEFEIDGKKARVLLTDEERHEIGDSIDLFYSSKTNEVVTPETVGYSPENIFIGICSLFVLLFLILAILFPEKVLRNLNKDSPVGIWL